MLDYKLKKFENGLKLITAPIPNTKAVTIFIMFKTGSRFETEEENGLAHFLEHMFFKGTQKRPEAMDIARELDAVGASFNAFTGEEYTGFFVRAESSHFNLGLDVLTDMLNNSVFKEEEITKEKGVIVEEINMYQDLPMAYVDNVMKELLWPNQPLGRTIAGKAETVTKFKREDFLRFKNNHYQPENMIVAIAGGQEGQDWEKEIQKYLGGLSNTKTPAYLPATAEQKAPALKIHYKETDQAHFLLGFRSLKRTDVRRPTLRILYNLLGGTMSSRLVTEVREKRGLCYYVNSRMEDFFDAGFFGAAAGVDIKRIEEAVKVILEEFSKLKTTLVTEEELKRAKENYKGQMYLDLEESMAVAQFLADQEMLWGKIQDPDDIIKDYEKVTREDIMELANEILNPKNLNLAIVGPYKDKEIFNKILMEFK